MAMENGQSRTEDLRRSVDPAASGDYGRADSGWLTLLIPAPP
jgi:hypothetical protein